MDLVEDYSFPSSVLMRGIRRVAELRFTCVLNCLDLMQFLYSWPVVIAHLSKSLKQISVS
jgi:hypothetical protein